MKHLFVRILVAQVCALVLCSAACSSTTKVAPPTDAGPPSCDPTHCAPKNTCIDNGTDTQCRLGCATQTDCPFNYVCSPNPTQVQNYCVKMTTDTPQKPTGQWGTPCLPSGGQEGNPACDAATGFACHGVGTTDATAYCTQYDCMADLDCAGGYWCATINVAPNVKTDVRTFGKTRTACLKRSYCAPCAGDVDCGVVDGVQSRCFDDGSGATPFCAPPCTSSANCRLDATCSGGLGDGTKVCRPRAGVCKGDGTVCSPCRSDGDCPNGFCLKGAYSPETFCSVKSTTACEASGQATIVKGTCPPFTAFAGTTIGCQSAGDDVNIPKDQCIGLINFGDTGDIACWTKH